MRLKSRECTLEVLPKEVLAHHHRRQRISQENRERLAIAFDEQKQDYLSVADTLGISSSTARGIVRRYLEEGRMNERASLWQAKSCQSGWRNEAMYCGYTRRESRFNS